MRTEHRELGRERISQEAMLSNAEHLRTLKRERGCETERGHLTLGNRQGWKTRQVITLICGHMALQAFVKGIIMRMKEYDHRGAGKK